MTTIQQMVDLFEPGIEKKRENITNTREKNNVDTKENRSPKTN